MVIARGALDRLGTRTRQATGARRVALITDARVRRLHARRAIDSLRRSGCSVVTIVVPVGEAAKTARQLTRLWQTFARHRLGRGDAVVALGGGTIGDLSGFAAASWLRGVP